MIDIICWITVGLKVMFGFAQVARQIADHEKFMEELKEKEKDKDFTLDLAREILDKCHPDAVNVIKHWIQIIQSRWDEIANWALQRSDMLQEHLKQLKVNLIALVDRIKYNSKIQILS